MRLNKNDALTLLAWSGFDSPAYRAGIRAYYGRPVSAQQQRAALPELRACLDWIRRTGNGEDPDLESLVRRLARV